MKTHYLIIFVLIVLAGLLYAARDYYYQITPSQCNNCGRCYSHCPTHAIYYNTTLHKYQIHPELCNGDAICVSWCPRGAIHPVEIVGVEDQNTPNPTMQVRIYPNPVPLNGTATMAYSLPKNQTKGILMITNPKGQLVRKLALDSRSANVQFDGKDDNGRQLPGGNYFALFISGKERITSKLSLERK